MKPGDLIRRKTYGWFAVVLERIDDTVDGDFIKFVYVDNGELDGASTSLFEVINESR